MDHQQKKIEEADDEEGTTYAKLPRRESGPMDKTWNGGKQAYDEATTQKTSEISYSKFREP